MNINQAIQQLVNKFQLRANAILAIANIITYPVVQLITDEQYLQLIQVCQNLVANKYTSKYDLYFQLLDQDCNDVISSAEFLKFIKLMGIDINLQNINRLLESVGLNTEKITIDQFENVVKSVVKTVQ